MAYLNVKDRVLEAKIVYYGAGLSGKTTNLEQIKRLVTDGRVGELTSLNTDGDRTLFFDYLPFSVGKVNGCDVKVQLYTVPGQAKYAETRKRVLAGADGVVLVLDSDAGALDRNRQTVIDLHDHLREIGVAETQIAILVQLNKRDVPTAMVPEELLAAVGMAAAPHVPATAINGEGVMETLREATRIVLEVVRDQAKRGAPIKQVSKSQLDGAATYKTLVDSGLAPDPTPPPPPAPVAPPVAVNGRAVAAATVPPADPLTSQLGEVIQSVRGLGRRLDGLEAALTQHVSTSLAAFERTLGGRLADTITAAVDAAVRRQLEGLGRRVDDAAAETRRHGDDAAAETRAYVESQVAATHASIEGVADQVVRSEAEARRRADEQRAGNAAQLRAISDASALAIREGLTGQQAALAGLQAAVTGQQAALDKLDHATHDEAKALRAAVEAAAKATLRGDTLDKGLSSMSSLLLEEVRQRAASVDTALQAEAKERKGGLAALEARLAQLATKVAETSDLHVVKLVDLGKHVDQTTTRVESRVADAERRLDDKQSQAAGRAETAVTAGLAEAQTHLAALRERVEEIVRAITEQDSKKKSWFR
jgi:signal recognition particle receptor subunit beta